MARNRERRGKAGLASWLGWAGFDAGGRLALLTASTAIFSRLLSAHDFGVTALVLTVVAIASVFVGAPFEEALAQISVLRKTHLNTALAASWLVAVVLVALSVLAGWFLSDLYGEPSLHLLLPVGMTSIFFNGHADIATALARRLKRFNDIAFANLVGNAIGIFIALLMAVAGAGLWSLIAQRVLIALARAVLLQWRLGFLIRPDWSPSRFHEMKRFAGISLFDRLADNLNYPVFNDVVAGFYGVTVLGYVNMAMRLIEPIRGAVLATGHNLAFSYFAPVYLNPVLFKGRLDLVVSRASLVIAPIFFGMAAVMPILLPIVAGQGWDESIAIAICLAVGSAIMLPARLIYTALSASARPQFSLISNLSGLVVTLVTLLAASPFGPISVGLSRIAGDGVQAVLAILISPRILPWSRSDRLHALLPAWQLSIAMTAVVGSVVVFWPTANRYLLLILSIVLGIAVYAALLGLFARQTFEELKRSVFPRHPTTRAS